MQRALALGGACREAPLSVKQRQKPQTSRLQLGAVPCRLLHVQSHDSPQCLFLGTTEGEGWGHFTMCL